MPLALLLYDFVPNQRRTFEAFLLGVARQLQADGWRAVFVFAGEPSEGFAADLRSAGAEYRVTPFPPRVEAVEALPLPERPLIMATAFVSYFTPSLRAIKKRLGIRHWVAHDHSSGVASPKTGVKRLLAWLRGWYVGRHLDRVLAVSEYVARRNVEQSFLPPSKVKVLPNGVDLNHFRPADVPPAADPPRVVYVGQLTREKGVFTLLRAVAMLRCRPVVEIAGKGAAEGELRAFAADNRLSHVTFLGQVADVPALFRAATVVVAPSEWAEAFGLVVLEAMACGACVLASDAGGLPEVVGRDEEGGRLFRSGDADDLAAKLLALLDDPPARERLRTQARARAERLFGLDGMVQGFVRELQEAARQG